MNCWKTINLTRDYGTNRIYLVSFLIGVLSFIVLYLAFSMIHQSVTVEDHGLWPLIAGILALPAAHKLMHVLPLILLNKRIKIKWNRKFWIFPNFSFITKSKMTKPTSLMSLLAPTFLLTVPGMISSYLFADYFVYFLIFTAVNIGCSSTDFLYIKLFLRAPRRCVVENDHDGYDILIQ